MLLLLMLCVVFYASNSFTPSVSQGLARLNFFPFGRRSMLSNPSSRTITKPPIRDVAGISPSNIWRDYSGSKSSLLAKKFVAAEVLNNFNYLSSRSSNRRAKMGPPKRKQNYNSREDREYEVKDNFASPLLPRAGRVSVYCVGSGIDISSLRAHVFRRGFGNSINHQQFSPHNASYDQTEIIASTNTLRLTRRAEDPILDDEMLHVSNAPILISTSNHGPAWDKEEQLEEMLDEANIDHQHNTYRNPLRTSGIDTFEMSQHRSESNTQLNPKTKEKLLMATQDIFYFEYGCVVFWGLTSHEEKAALEELSPFIVEPVTPTELENSFDTMEYIFDHHVSDANNGHSSSANQRPIKFDRMRLRSLRLEEKLAYSYAMAQSSKLFVFESKVLQSVERTRYLPKELANKGKITCSKRELNSLIGQLFVEQTEVNLFSSILDTPDFLWDDDEYLPTYQFSRSYLEVDHRVSLLNSRLSVIRELLDVLTAQVADNNSTRLEWIVIWLIVIEIGLGIATSPLFTGNRIVASLVVPAAIFLYKQMTTSDR